MQKNAVLLCAFACTAAAQTFPPSIPSYYWSHTLYSSTNCSAGSEIDSWFMLPGWQYASWAGVNGLNLQNIWLVDFWGQATINIGANINHALWGVASSDAWAENIGGQNQQFGPCTSAAGPLSGLLGSTSGGVKSYNYSNYYGYPIPDDMQTMTIRTTPVPGYAHVFSYVTENVNNSETTGVVYTNMHMQALGACVPTGVLIAGDGTDAGVSEPFSIGGTPSAYTKLEFDTTSGELVYTSGYKNESCSTPQVSGLATRRYSMTQHSATQLARLTTVKTQIYDDDLGAVSPLIRGYGIAVTLTTPYVPVTTSAASSTSSNIPSPGSANGTPSLSGQAVAVIVVVSVVAAALSVGAVLYAYYGYGRRGHTRLGA